VKVCFGESLAGTLTKKSDGKADIIIGKESVVKHDAKENKFDVVPVAVEGSEIQASRRALQEALGDVGMASTQPIELGAIGVVLRFGQLDQAQQSVGDATTSR
jgi:hypothetical protein